MKQEFLSNVFGTLTPGAFFSYLFFAYVGVGMTLLYNASTRNPNELRTPTKFSHRFLLWDNRYRLILSFALVVISIRFYHDVMGRDINNFGALGIGIGYDKLSEMIFKKPKKTPETTPDEATDATPV